LRTTYFEYDDGSLGTIIDNNIKGVVIRHYRGLLI